MTDTNPAALTLPNARGEMTVAEKSDLSALIDELSSENLTYATPSMFDRRRRMLLVARELIAERGYEGATVRELCARAEVSSHTLYKVFVNKERLVAVAIGSYFRQLYQRSSLGVQSHTLPGVIQHIMINDRAMIDDRELTHALIAIHYSAGVDETVRAMTREKGKMIFAPWVDALFMNGYLRRGVTPAKLVQDLTSLLFAISWDWCRGIVPDDEFFGAKLSAMLTFASGATRSAGHAEINAELARLTGT